MIERLKESQEAAFGFRVVGRITADEVKAFEPQIEFIIAERKQRPIGVLADISQMEGADWKARWLEMRFLQKYTNLLKAVLAARARGVNARVMLNPARRSGEEDNEKSQRTLIADGVDVLDSNPAYDVTHEKSMEVDDTHAFVKSLNWQTKNLTETRDYAVVTSHAHEVNEIVECFEADWSRKGFESGKTLT